MIVDVHTHVPSHIDNVPFEEEMRESKMRPDRAVRLTTTYDDFFEAMKLVDRVISFGIAMPADRPVIIGKKEMKDLASLWSKVAEMQEAMRTLVAKAIRSNDILYACRFCKHLWR